MDTVFVKKGSSKSYTNLITSSAPIPLKKNLSQEPIGQQQQSLGINNVETETAHKREKRATAGVSVCGSVSFSKFIWYFMQSTASQTGIETPSIVYFHVQHFILDFL